MPMPSLRPLLLFPLLAAPLCGQSPVVQTPAQPDALSLIHRLEERRHQAPLTVDESLALAAALTAQGQLEPASSTLNQAIAAHPQAVELYRQLALILRLRKQSGAAIATLDKALALDPANRSLRILALHLQLDDLTRDPMALAQQLLAEAPGDLDLLLANATLATRHSDLDSAKAHLLKAVQLHPSSAEAHHQLGSLLAQQKDLSAARTELENAIRLGLDTPQIHYELARILAALGQGSQARDALATFSAEKHQQAKIEQAAALMQQADAAMATADFASAATLYRRAMAEDSTNADLPYKLSRALDRLGQIADEIAALHAALAIHPKMVEPLNQLAMLELKAAEFDAARSHLNAALEASPAYLPAWINLAVLEASEQHWTAARAALTRALALDPANPQALQLRSAIDEAAAQ